MKTHISVLRQAQLLGLAGAALLLPGLASASNLGVAVKAGTLGYGIEGDYIISEHFSVRVQANKFDYDDTFKEDDVEYEGTLSLSTYGALLDWHPMGGGFRISVGAFSNSNELSGVAEGEGTYDIGDQTYTVGPNDDFRATTKVKLGTSLAPYAGIGWGHSPANTGGLLLSVDFGVLIQGSPSVDLNVSGTAQNGAVDFSTDPTLQAQVQEEEANLEDDLSEFKLYPVVSFGIGWRF